MTAMEIMAAVAQRRGVQVSAIRGMARGAKLTAARREIISAMRASGKTIGQIADQLNLTPCAIKYHLYPNKRAQQAKRRRERMGLATEENRIVLVRSHLWATLVQYSELENINVETAVNRFIRDGLESA